jgi:3-phenylpropionate/trans-cinnamate dioxygenase ferredoxin subunit
MKLNFSRVPGAASIPLGACRSIECDGRPIIVAHLADGYYAVEDRCSHADSNLNPSRLYHGRQIACPIHGARFDLKTGEPKSPPAFRAIASFPTRMVNGEVEIALPVREPAA